MANLRYDVERIYDRPKKAIKRLKRSPPRGWKNFSKNSSLEGFDEEK